jgi:hypothetical protein
MTLTNESFFSINCTIHLIAEMIKITKKLVVTFTLVLLGVLIIFAISNNKIAESIRQELLPRSREKGNSRLSEALSDHEFAVKDRIRTARSFDDIFVEEEIITLNTSPDEPILYANDLKISPDQHIYIINSHSCRIHMFDIQGKWLRSFGTRGKGPTEFGSLGGIGFAPDGYLYIADASNERVSVWDTLGNFLKTIPLEKRVHDIEFLTAAKFMGFSFETNIISVFDTTGRELISYGEWRDLSEKFVRKYRIPLLGGSFAVDKAYNVYFAFVGNYTIRKYAFDGTLAAEFGRPDAPFYREPDQLPSNATPQALQKWQESWTPVNRVVAMPFGITIVQIQVFEASDDYICVLDFFDQDGNFINGGITTQFRVGACDSSGKIYFIEDLESQSDALEIVNPALRKFKIADASNN